MNFQIICLSFLVCNYFAIVGSLNDEGFALLSFKQSMKNYTNSYLNNWNSSDISPCSWKGVTCSGGKVVALTIPNRKLVGFLPTALGKLSALRHVNLRNNNFFGILPVELFDARELQSLVLSGNSLSGPIPPEIGKLKKLQTLDLSHNSFNSSIPSSLDQCKRLKGTLDLSDNFLNGPIPASLGSLPETLYIDLSCNNLSGPIPQNGALSNLGPTAFIGNSLLCGAPLKISCSPPYSQSLFHYPSQNSAKNGKGSDPNLGIVITIVASVMVGICLVWLLVYYRCRKISAYKDGVNVGGCSFEKALMVRREFFCFAKDNPETLSENIERYNFVQLDQQQPNFDLDQLLKASAFLLGKTGNGIVYKVVLEGGPILAVRRLEEDGGSQRSREFQAEVEAIGKVRHPNIVTLRAYCCSVDEKLIIYDYIPNGDLATAIHGKAGTVPFKPLSWPLRLRIMKGLAKGLAFLHEFSHKRYVHGNLKPSNILLGQNMEPHISDFGLRHLVNIDRESQRTCDLEQMTNGTPQSNSSSEFLPSSPSVTAGSCYQAPEAFKVSRPSQKWDVYSFGVILLEMISGKFPIIKMGVLEVNLVQWIQLSVEERKPLSSVLDPFMAHEIDKEKEIVDVVQIALACVQKSPERRPSMRFVCENLERLVSSTY